MKKLATGSARLRRGAVFFLSATLLVGCTVRGVREAPIEDRSTANRTARPAAPITSAPAATAPAPIAGREASHGTYVVQRGDTLYSIAVAFGQDYRDIARWNNLDDPTKLSVGQSLRVSAPEGDTGAAAVVGVVTVAPSTGTETRPLDSVPSAPASSTLPPAAPAPPATATAPPPTTTAPIAPSANVSKPQPASPPAPAAATGGGNLLWQWPAKGKVLDGYNETRNKGIDIGGTEGEAVLAAGDGDVVYSGSGLRVYGNLVIIKHSDDYISAYAHNRQILIKQGDTVRRGQRIADLGKADDGQAKLHFEIRYRGKPVDPLKYLPPR